MHGLELVGATLFSTACFMYSMRCFIQASHHSIRHARARYLALSGAWAVITFMILYTGA